MSCIYFPIAALLISVLVNIIFRTKENANNNEIKEEKKDWFMKWNVQKNN